MNIAISMISDDIIKLIDVSEYEKIQSVFNDVDLVCPSCGTRLKYLKKSDGSEEFIAEANNYHNICKKEVAKNFYTPISKELFFKLSEEDISKYLNLICSEYRAFLEMPISNVVKSKINSLKRLDFSKSTFDNNNDCVFEVMDIRSFLKKPKEKVFLVAEIINCFINEEFIYLDLFAGNNKVSIFLDKKIINTLNQKEINFIKLICNKKRKFVVSLYVNEINRKKSNGINMSLKSKKLINIHEIKVSK